MHFPGEGMRRYGAVSFPQGDQLQKRPEQAESVPACALCSLGFQPVLKILLLLRGTLQSWGQQTWTIGQLGAGINVRRKSFPKGDFGASTRLWLCSVCSSSASPCAALWQTAAREGKTSALISWHHLVCQSILPLPSGCCGGIRRPSFGRRHSSFCWSCWEPGASTPWEGSAVQYQTDNEKEAVVFFCPRIFLFSDTWI